MNNKSEVSVSVKAIAVKIASTFVAKNDVRYFLKSIHVMPAPTGGVLVQATDGHKLIVVHDYEGKASEPVHIELNPQMSSTLTASRLVEINGHKMQVCSIDRIPVYQHYDLIDRRIEGWTKFPDFSKIFNANEYEKGLVGMINPEYLAVAVNAGKYFSFVQFLSKKGSKGLDPVAIVFEGNNRFSAVAVIMPLRDNEKAFDWIPQYFQGKQ